MSNPNTKFMFFDPHQGIVPPFTFTKVLDINESNESSLYLSIYNEFTYQHGTDVIFIERTPNEAEEIFGEYLQKKISRGTPMRLFVEEVEMWNGAGDTYTKFGLQVNDECTLHCPKIAFEQSRPGLYPKYNDLIYLVNAKKLFEITHIEDETSPAFYLLGNRSCYKISCKTYAYDHSEISDDISIPTEIQALDKLVNNPITGIDWDIQEKEISRSNKKVEQIKIAEQIIDSTENDPLLG